MNLRLFVSGTASRIDRTLDRVWTVDQEQSSTRPAAMIKAVFQAYIQAEIWHVHPKFVFAGVPWQLQQNHIEKQVVLSSLAKKMQHTGRAVLMPILTQCTRHPTIFIPCFDQPKTARAGDISGFL